MGVSAAVRSAQMMALIEQGLDFLDVLGHGLRQPLGHAAEAAEGAAASSDLSELLGCPVIPSNMIKRPKHFACSRSEEQPLGTLHDHRCAFANSSAPSSAVIVALWSR